jgi:zinc/manganese transport system ATP-binding protein
VVLQWHEAGRTVIVVLHDLGHVRAHFPTALLLARSCIGWGDTASVVTEENLARARDTVRGRTEGPVLA